MEFLEIQKRYDKTEINKRIIIRQVSMQRERFKKILIPELSNDSFCHRHTGKYISKGIRKCQVLSG